MRHYFTYKLVLSCVLASLGWSTLAQEENVEIFQGTRIINGHSTETLGKGVLEFRVEHRFGDIAGDNGGVQRMFGLDNSSDIRLAFEYGLKDNWMIGVGRSKGNGAPYTNLLDGFTKHRFLTQGDKSPLSLAALGTMSYTYMKASEDVALVSHFPKQVHRFAYSLQLNAAKRFGDHFSLALMPTMVHRNYVLTSDRNTLFSMGGALRWSINGTWGILVEYYQNIHEDGVRSNNHNSLSFAVEWMTFGHNFTIYVTNASGFGETQFITNTYEDWLKGQFRLGFCIGRKFERG